MIGIGLSLAGGQRGRVGPAYTRWSGGAVYDASDDSMVLRTGSTVTGLNNSKRTGQGNLIAAGTVGNITRVAAAQNGRPAIRLVRDVAASVVVPRLVSTVSDPISMMFQGDDKPYTAIVAFKPTDTNTRFVWSASVTTDATDAEVIGLVSRNGSAGSSRRARVAATPLDVNYGAGDASGMPLIVAIVSNGTTVSIWKSSLTKTVDAAAQDAEAMSSNLVFALFAARAAGGSNPTYSLTQGNMDFYEAAFSSAAQADAEVRQAITDMAVKWTITLV